MKRNYFLLKCEVLQPRIQLDFREIGMDLYYMCDSYTFTVYNCSQ